MLRQRRAGHGRSAVLPVGLPRGRTGPCGALAVVNGGYVGPRTLVVLGWSRRAGGVCADHPTGRIEEEHADVDSI